MELSGENLILEQQCKKQKEVIDKATNELFILKDMIYKPETREEYFDNYKIAQGIIEIWKIIANTNKYSATAEEKANDINEMFADKEVKMIWCAKGGENSNSVFDYINYDIIRQNPKIICGYSDITSLTNIITEKTGLITFSGTNFKTIATDETDYSLKEALKRFISRKFRIRYTRR